MAETSAGEQPISVQERRATCHVRVDGESIVKVATRADIRRVRIGYNHVKRPMPLILVGIPVIYVPLITSVPFAILCVWLVRLHLWCMGAQGLLRYSDFVPDWVSHRYTHESQVRMYSRSIVMRWLLRRKVFWIFNCKLYCPLSVALFGYLNYLVKVVENWWCPFNHSKKSCYVEAAIDRSIWHIGTKNPAKLHADDRNNPVWFKDADREIIDTKDNVPLL